MGKKRIKNRNKSTQRPARDAATARVLRRAREAGIHNKIEVVESSEELEQMSEVVLDFAGPFIEDVKEDYKALKSVIGLVILAWNLAMVDGKERQETIRELLAGLPEDDPEFVDFFETMLRMLIARKIIHFPENQRFILDYEMSKTKEGPHLQVVSTVPAEMYDRYSSAP